MNLSEKIDYVASNVIGVGVFIYSGQSHYYDVYTDYERTHE